MNIYGYTQEKDLVLVDMKSEDIVAAGIDPWRIDLCDPDPVVYEKDDQVFLFRRLRDIAFVYPDTRDRTQMCLCWLEDGQPVCIVGEGRGNNTRLQFLNYRPSDRTFAEHLREYLYDCLLFGTRSYSCWPPRPTKAVVVEGSSVWFGAPMQSSFHCKTINFTGHMCEEITVPTRLDERINRILILLREWNPVIVGEPLRQSLRGERPERVHVKIYLPDMAIVSSVLKTAGFRDVNSKEFEYRDCHYYFTGKPSGFRQLFAGTSLQLFSTDWLYCTGPNQLTGTRIAFFDLSKNQTRPLVYEGTPDENKARRHGLSLAQCVDGATEAQIV